MRWQRVLPSILFVTGVWYVWCWRNNTIFEDQHWRIQDVMRKIFLLHDECISYYPNLSSDPQSSRLLAHWSPSPEGTLKLSIDGRFLEDFGFSHYEDGGDALLAELRAIQIGLDFCCKKGYVNIICESDCLEAVDLIIDSRDHHLHTYATDILHIRDALLGDGNTTLVYVFREQNMCADFMAKEGSHTRCSAHWNCPPPGMESLILRDKLGT